MHEPPEGSKVSLLIASPFKTQLMRTFYIFYLLGAFFFLWAQPTQSVDNFKITVLSTMLSDFYLGEWGFSALVEVDGQRLLFDTGSRENTVWQNAQQMDLDLNGIPHVYLSHNHADHTRGLFTLKKTYPTSFGQAHVGEGIFYPRPHEQGEAHYLIQNKERLEALGVRFVNHNKVSEIIPGVYTTGPIPRVYDEKNWSRLGKLIAPNGDRIEDTIPEDQSLFFDTEKGIVLISGCGHAGLVNTLTYIRSILPGRPIYKILGGFHLLKLSDEKLRWTASKLKEFGVTYFVGAHCTGINATYSLREYMDLTKDQVMVGSVGTYIDGEGIHPGYME